MTIRLARAIAPAGLYPLRVALLIGLALCAGLMSATPVLAALVQLSDQLEMFDGTTLIATAAGPELLPEQAETILLNSVTVSRLLPASVGGVVLTEPGTGNISDILTVVVSLTSDPPCPLPFNCTFFTFTLLSDPILDPVTLPGGLQLSQLPRLVETGDFQDVTSALGLAGEGITVLLKSDIEATVPEPGALVLLSAGFSGLIGWRYRRRIVHLKVKGFRTL